jgi:small-conductance mechanosensitive channel
VFLNSTVIAAAIFIGVIAGFAALAVYTGLAVYASILAIGLALALQKYVSSYFGFFIVRFSNIFNVGDRIRMGNIKGDVKHIGLFHFVLEEVGEDEKLGGELTGRILHIPNLIVLDQPVLNYSKSYSAGDRLVACDYIFDEIRIPLTVKSDIDEAARLFDDILKSADQPIIEESKDAFRNDYPEFLREAEEGPRILVHLEPQRVWLKGKLVVPVRTRNQLKSEVINEFLRQIKIRENIQVA